MKVVWSWLAEFVNLSDRTPLEVAETLESLGHEVENIVGSQFENVIVGKVLSVEPHPNADRLRVAQVDLGTHTEIIVCGAPNLAPGQLVPVALPGALLPGGLKIISRDIRGVVSAGMICAADELGIGGDHTGILVLTDASQPGDAFKAESSEAVLDIAITPNRGDVLSLLGVARELAAKWETELMAGARKGSSDDFSHLPHDFPDKRLVALRSKSCPFYTLRLLRDITPNHLPSVITGRLQAAGHSIIHPIVDITNYVMEEIGVPLHAFDADKVEGAIEVRPGQEKETITLLDGKTYPVKDALVIADEAGPIALAGIMGGDRTAVTEGTKNVLLEAAYFDPATIRATRKALNLTTSASYRFERGVDPFGAMVASDRAAELIKEHLEASIGERNDSGVISHQPAVSFNPDDINNRLGTNIQGVEMEGVLTRLGFTLRQEIVQPPSWRSDISILEDLSEEIARVVGYDTIPRLELATRPVEDNPDDQAFYGREQIKDVLVSKGWTEHIGSSFLSPREKFSVGYQDDATTRLANPVSEEAAYLRPGLMISLLKAIAKNPIFPTLQFFEMGTVFSPQAEQTQLALAATGKEGKRALEELNVSPIQTVEQSLLDSLKIRRPVYFFEADPQVFLELLGIKPETIHFTLPTISKITMPSKYQPVLRDIALLTTIDIDGSLLQKTIEGIQYVTDVELFDEYQGPTLPEGKKSLAYHILIEHPERSLTSEEIDEIMVKIQKILANNFSATIRE